MHYKKVDISRIQQTEVSLVHHRQTSSANKNTNPPLSYNAAPYLSQSEDRVTEVVLSSLLSPNATHPYCRVEVSRKRKMSSNLLALLKVLRDHCSDTLDGPVSFQVPGCDAELEA